MTGMCERRRRRQLLDGLIETVEYCKLKEEALGGNVWRTSLGRCYGRNEQANE